MEMAKFAISKFVASTGRSGYWSSASTTVLAMMNATMAPLNHPDATTRCTAMRAASRHPAWGASPPDASTNSYKLPSAAFAACSAVEYCPKRAAFCCSRAFCAAPVRVLWRRWRADGVSAPLPRGVGGACGTPVDGGPSEGAALAPHPTQLMSPPPRLPSPSLGLPGAVALAPSSAPSTSTVARAGGAPFRRASLVEPAPAPSRGWGEAELAVGEAGSPGTAGRYKLAGEAASPPARRVEPPLRILRFGGPLVV